MQAKILNLLSNKTIHNQNLSSGHGQSFLITIDDEVVLYDTGFSGEALLHNMETLSVSPDTVTTLVLSHGHFDHTGGLPGFLDKRKTSQTLPLIAHPNFNERKIYTILNFIKKSISCPELTENQHNKLKYHLTKEPVPIAFNLRTTGEITERNATHTLEKNAMHLKNGKYVVDPIDDDLSLILTSKKGEVIITGCAHSGILNICSYVKRTSNKPIHAIIGGTHMVRYSEDEVKYVAAQLVNTFDNPDLYLNHCTDCFPDPFVRKTQATAILKKELGPDKVKECCVGTEIRFEV
jgi:7,8-dihydropterin-6-yl-methyl-4-(beta-D-ribofuranosyl)aminobenzene 5'-phosphate synthase